ncbi:MAG: hypothetical protein ACJA0E_000765 [Bermanella sp.]|jgi:hypothetical protein
MHYLSWRLTYFSFLAGSVNLLSSELDNFRSGLIETNFALSILMAAFDACALGNKNAKKSASFCLVLV